MTEPTTTKLTSSILNPKGNATTTGPFPIEKFFEFGLLGKLNKEVLHPEGLAMGLIYTDNEITGFEIWHDLEPWEFDQEGYEDIASKFGAFKQQISEAAAKERIA